MDFDRFQRLLQRIERSRVASLSDLVGCSEQEVAALEARYGLRLPQTYELYLRVMGHKSGRLFTHDHMDVFYSNALEMTAEHRQMWAEWQAERGDDPPPSFTLPTDALIIGSRLREQFEFIRCSGQEDSPVWYFNEWDWRTQLEYPSVLAWLESWCVEAESAIASGYFDRYRTGTRP